MEDQAEELRRQRGVVSPMEVSRAHFITVTSGKGGVGKSNFALNLSLALAQMGRRVLLVDADANLANLDLLLDLRPPYHLGDVMRGEKRVEEILVELPHHLTLLPAASGDFSLFGLEEDAHQRLRDSFSTLETQFQFIVIDTGAGLNSTIVSYAASSDEVVVVTQSEPTAAADAYAVIKMIWRANPHTRIFILVNRIKRESEAYELFDRLNLVTHNFLQFDLMFLGYLPEDGAVGQAVGAQSPFLLMFPRSSASNRVRMIARRLLYPSAHPLDHSTERWWDRVMNIIKGQTYESHTSD